jgi:acetoin utilization deacetylase AcuC-like enzyme
VTVGFVSHPSSLLHEMPAGHPERSDRIAAITEHLTRTGIDAEVGQHEPRPATRAVLELVHEARSLDELEAMDAEGGGYIDSDTSMGPHSLQAALCGTQGAVDAVERVLDGSWSGAFVCTRPPGHHATPFRAMGFCLTNHAAVAARWAVASGRVERAVVLDFDAHHGNGTQDAFYADPSVLYVSLHQYPWYPGSGDVTERGTGDGMGTTLNVPLPAGAAESAYTQAFDELIEPQVAAFDPQLVVVSAGYDAHHHDPLCMMRLTAGAFARMTDRVAAWGPGPVCVLEGGYDLEALAWGTAATIGTLLGRPTAGVPDQETGELAGHPEASIWIERAIGVVGRL